MHTCTGGQFDFMSCKYVIINVTSQLIKRKLLIIYIHQAQTRPSWNTILKYTSLILLVIQNTFVVLLLRYSRTMDSTRYLTSTAVVITEIQKFIACFFLVLHGQGWKLMPTLKLLKYEIIEKYHETLKVSIPSFLYTVQNNLIYVALSNLDAATFQVSSLSHPLCPSALSLSPSLSLSFLLSFPLSLSLSLSLRLSLRLSLSLSLSTKEFITNI